MGEQFLDDLAKGLDDGTLSRRRALKLAGGVLLAAVVPTLIPREAEARRRRRNPCRGKTPICEPGGIQENCKGNPKCFCGRTVEGGKKCVNILPFEDTCFPTDACNSSADCAADEVCINSSCICGPELSRACFRKCS